MLKSGETSLQREHWILIAQLSLTFSFTAYKVLLSQRCVPCTKRNICVSLTEFIYCQMIRVEDPLAFFSKNRLIFMSLLPVFPVLACFIQRIHYCVDHLVDVRFV